MKVTATGSAVVITSSMKKEELEYIQKYRPEALTTYGGEDGKEPIFCIRVTDGRSSINENGAQFGEATRDENKYACITMVLENDCEDIKSQIADQIGGALTKLAALEATLPAVVTEIKNERARIMESITVL